MKKRYSEPEEKKKPKLTLTSARAFLGQGAGLAPAQPPKSVPPDKGDSIITRGTVKENLLKQEFSGRDTSINSAKTPAVYNMVDKIGGWHEGSVNIDVGGGKYDTLTRALADKGVTSYIYEPYGRTINENAYILAQLQSNALRGDTATCSNVLNVIKESDMRANVVHQVAKAIKPEGVAYFTIYEGNKAGRGAVSKDDCWQNNRRVGTYVDEVRQHFGDVQMKGNLIIARKPLHTGIPAEWRLGADGGVVHFSFTDNDGNLHNLSRAYATDAQGNKLGEEVYITTPLGNLDWYKFPQDEKTQKLLAAHNVKNLPIRLKVGKQTTQPHRGFGFMHILNHYDDFENIGESPLLHLYNTLSNLLKIRGGYGGRYQFKGEYEGGRDILLAAQLLEDEGCYSMVSCYPTQMNRRPQRGELVIGRVLFQFIPSSEGSQIQVSKSQDKATASSRKH